MQRINFNELRKRGKFFSMVLAASILTTVFLVQPMQVWTQEEERLAVPEAHPDFTQGPWTLATCVNVATGGLQNGFWADTPAGTMNNEAINFWIVTDSPLNEKCTYNDEFTFTTGPPGGGLSYRVAVNDGAIFTVALKNGSTNCVDGTTVATVSTLGTQDTSGFLTKTVGVPGETTFTDICVTIDDDPDADASQVPGHRASAVIDYIHIETVISGLIYSEDGNGIG